MNNVFFVCPVCCTRLSVPANWRKVPIHGTSSMLRAGTPCPVSRRLRTRCIADKVLRGLKCDAKAAREREAAYALIRIFRRNDLTPSEQRRVRMMVAAALKR